MALQPHVSKDFLQQLSDAFGDRLRLRWSAKTNTWQIEQRVGRSVLAPREMDPNNDRYIRARDGYVHVMTIQPHTQTACPKCGCAIKCPELRTAEVRCSWCTLAGRDGRYAIGWYPFNHHLITHLHRISPDRDGALNGMREADLHHERRLLGMERHMRDQQVAGLKEDIGRVLGIPRVSGFHSKL